MRTKLEDVTAITTARLVIERQEDQAFYQTPKAYELWQETPLRFLKRWSRKAVFFVFTQKD